MLTSRHTMLISSLFLSMISSAMAEQLKPFASDGCSQFPDGTLTEKNLWCSCCITHDLAYWQGGNRQQKQQADDVLRACVLKSTQNELLAETMYIGVRVGGLPLFPVWYRWGYGWKYGRGFQSLTVIEKQQVAIQILNYKSALPKAYCDFEYPPTKMIQESWQGMVENLK